MRTLKHWAAAALLFAGLQSAAAETPKDMLVIAFQIDDLITLDPAEIYELTGGEYAANVYDRLVYYDIADIADIKGGIAESWTVSPDGKTFTFKIRDGMTFHSGNPVTAADAAWSLQRVVKLNKGPAFILGEFGLTPENVEQKVRAESDTLVLETDKAYAPSFVLNCLGSWVSSVLDAKTVLAHAADGDLGNGWLKTHSAGSGPFSLVSWKANESLVLQRHDGYWRGAPAMRRVVVRHIPEPGTQRLLLEKGDVDIARNLGADDLEALQDNPDIRVRGIPQGAVTYLGLSQKHPALSNPKVRQALKYLIDYDGIQQNILRGTKVVHQAFLPAGFLGAVDDNPFTLDVAKAKTLLAEAGFADGFTVTMDTRNTSPTTDIAQAIQANWAQAGIKLEILPGDNKQTLTKYRARTHDIYIGRWAPDYLDPHSNASGFAINDDNADDAPLKLLAWRNSWYIPEMSAKVAAALAEPDTAKRAALYGDIQREHQATSPFVIMFQDIHVVAERKGVEGFEVGPNFDTVYYRAVTKN